MINFYEDDKDLSSYDLGEDNQNFIKDIKGYYSKIHQEIAQLKNILIDSAKHNIPANSSPLSSRNNYLAQEKNNPSKT